MKTILAFGGGIDSTAILSLILSDKFPKPDAILFSDPGSEFPETYQTVSLAAQRCARAQIRFETVYKRDGQGQRLTIRKWLASNGTVPVMPGGPHVCSLKFKGEPMQLWAETEFPGEDITWLIGIEANEGRRTKRFTPPKGSIHKYRYPLQERNLTRQDCMEIVADLWLAPVRKSSCTFCPFMSRCEISDLMNRPEWHTAKEIEQQFMATSSIKYNAWLDAGKPMNGRRAPPGMWRKDSWKEGNRLFAKTVQGKRLSIDEWEEEITDPIQPTII